MDPASAGVCSGDSPVLCWRERGSRTEESQALRKEPGCGLLCPESVGLNWLNVPHSQKQHLSSTAGAVKCECGTAAEAQGDRGNPCDIAFLTATRRQRLQLTLTVPTYCACIWVCVCGGWVCVCAWQREKDIFPHLQWQFWPNMRTCVTFNRNLLLVFPDADEFSGCTIQVTAQDVCATWISGIFVRTWRCWSLVTLGGTWKSL